MSINSTQGRRSLRVASTVNKMESHEVKQLNSTEQISTVMEMDVAGLEDYGSGRSKKKRTLPQGTHSNSETSENRIRRRGVKKMAQPPPVLFQRSTRSLVKITEAETKTNGPPLKMSRVTGVIALVDLKIPTPGKINYTSESTTFKVFDISPNKIIKDAFGFRRIVPVVDTEKPFHKIQELECFQNSLLSQIVQGSQCYNHTICDKYIKTARNGFVDTIIEAYMGHHNIVIRPDDVWLAIMTQFSFYVNDNSRKLRERFVNFKRQKILTLTLVDPESKYDIHSVPCDLITSLMTDMIDKNLVDSEVKDWISPNFSTTTPDDRLIAGVTLMATMKNYFKYVVRGCICGIPEVTLEGSVEDWNDIRNRIEKLREYDLDDWVDMLKPVLDQFIDAKSGDVDVEFWKNICHHDFEEGGGCYQPDRKYIGGWVTVFCPFSKNGKWHMNGSSSRSTKKGPKGELIRLTWPQIQIQSIAKGYVDVEIILDFHGKQHNAVMLAGHMAMEALPDRFTLRPTPGWVLALKDEAPPLTPYEEMMKNRGKKSSRK